jgi:hypothetical protein
MYFWHNSPEWSNDADTEVKRSEAVDYCKNLKEPGHWDHTDWRLPTSSELSAKKLDKNKYWASDSAEENPEAKMSVICVRNMQEKAEEKEPENTVLPEESDQTQPSPPKDPDPPDKLPKQGNGKCKTTFTIQDLTWCITTRKGLSWEETNQYCGNIQHGGKTSWRLPDSNEFQVLKPNFGKYFSASEDPPQRFWRSGGEEYYWDRFAEQPTTNGRVSSADSICVRKN